MLHPLLVYETETKVHRFFHPSTIIHNELYFYAVLYGPRFNGQSLNALHPHHFAFVDRKVCRIGIRSSRIQELSYRKPLKPGRFLPRQGDPMTRSFRDIPADNGIFIISDVGGSFGPNSGLSVDFGGVTACTIGGHIIREPFKSPAISGNAIVLVMPSQNRGKPFPCLRYRQMKSFPHLIFKLQEFCVQTPTHCLPLYNKLSLPCFSTNVGQSQKIKRIRFSHALLFAIFGHIATKLDQPGLISMQFKVEFLKALYKRFLESLRIMPVLKPHHEVIAKSYNYYVAACACFPPGLHPKVKCVMQVDVGKQAADTSPLWHTSFAGVFHPIPQNTAFSHFLICRKTRLSAIRRSINFIRHSWLMASKYPRISASSTQLTFFVIIAA